MRSIVDANLKSERHKQIYEYIQERVNKRLLTLKKEEVIDAFKTISTVKFKNNSNSIIITYPFGHYTSTSAASLFKDVKKLYRINKIKSLEQKLNNHEISPRAALLQFLDSFVGQCDLDSFKYKLVYEVFEFKAVNDQQARDIVACTINALKPKEEIALQEIRLDKRLT